MTGSVQAAAANGSTAVGAGRPVLTLTSRNYGAWSLRGWLLCRMAGLDFDESMVQSDDPDAHAELLLLAPSFRVPCLTIDGIQIWDTLAIAEFLHETFPDKGLLPADPAARAHCRSISGEMHSGFANLRSALPMNLRASYDRFPVWSAARADIARICEIWDQCLEAYGGPYLFGATLTAADAMFAPVCTRFVTYGIPLDERSRTYCDAMMKLSHLTDWMQQAAEEPDVIEELDIEF